MVLILVLIFVALNLTFRMLMINEICLVHLHKKLPLIYNRSCLEKNVFIFIFIKLNCNLLKNIKVFNDVMLNISDSSSFVSSTYGKYVVKSLTFTTAYVLVSHSNL